MSNFCIVLLSNSSCLKLRAPAGGAKYQIYSPKNQVFGENQKKMQKSILLYKK